MGWKKRAINSLAEARAEFDKADESLSSDSFARNPSLLAARMLCRGIKAASTSLVELYESLDDDDRIRVQHFFGPEFVSGILTITSGAHK